MAGISGKKWSRRKRMSFVEYIEETWRNKLYAIIMISIGAVPIVYDNDATVFMLMLIIGVPLFFSRKNWVF